MAIELFIKDTIQHLLHDFKLDTYAEQMKKDGRNPKMYYPLALLLV